MRALHKNFHRFSTQLLHSPSLTKKPFPIFTNRYQHTTHERTFYMRPLPSFCIPFSSSQGKQLFREALEAGGMEGYFALAEQYHTQSEPECKAWLTSQSETYVCRLWTWKFIDGAECFAIRS
jgi:hypothetical protein